MEDWESIAREEVNLYGPSTACGDFLGYVELLDLVRDHHVRAVARTVGNIDDKHSCQDNMIGFLDVGVEGKEGGEENEDVFREF